MISEPGGFHRSAGRSGSLPAARNNGFLTALSLRQAAGGCHSGDRPFRHLLTAGHLSTVLAVTLHLVTVRIAAVDGAAVRELRGAARTRRPCGGARALRATGRADRIRKGFGGQKQYRRSLYWRRLDPFAYKFYFLLAYCLHQALVLSDRGWLLGAGPLPERLRGNPVKTGLFSAGRNGATDRITASVPDSRRWPSRAKLAADISLPCKTIPNQAAPSSFQLYGI